MNKEVNGFGQSPIEKITKRLFEAQLSNWNAFFFTKNMLLTAYFLYE
jgi:hypothetical protein